jgi:hypothetical protein
MHAYDPVRFQPPAPVASVTLRNLQTGQAFADVPTLLDSGADVTLVPATAAQQIGVSVDPQVRYELAGFDGTAHFAPVVRLELAFCRRTFRGLFLVIDQECGVLGRNVLNSVPLLLDGPHHT